MFWHFLRGVEGKWDRFFGGRGEEVFVACSGSPEGGQDGPAQSYQEKEGKSVATAAATFFWKKNTTEIKERKKKLRSKRIRKSKKSGF